MLVLGLMLVLLAALVMLVFVIGGANDPASLKFGQFEWGPGVAAVFLAGVVTLVVLAIGLELTRIGVRRTRQRRRDAKELERLQLERQERQRQQATTEAQSADAEPAETRATEAPATETLQTEAPPNEGRPVDAPTAEEKRREPGQDV